MMQEQAAARQQYSYNPRESMLRHAFSTSNIETFNSTRPTNMEAVDYTGVPEGSRSDPGIVQATPKTRLVKRYVIVDASQRDWVKQPNPYSALVYTFGSQTTSATSPPVYENNPFVPTFALEQQILPSPIPGLPNNGGWTLTADPSNIRYPAYNSSLTRGNFIGYDTGYVIQPSGAGFGSVFTPSNVSAIRLVRAVLPQRQFFSIPIDPGTNAIDASTSDFIQSNIVGKPYSSFGTYPYLLFYLNEFFGQYVGGNEPMRRAFSVMTQKGRQQTNFRTDIGVQQYDYEPWNQEALQLQSPITNFQRLGITITDPIGTPFAQTDSLTIDLIQATSNQVYLKCFTGEQYFSSNDLRVGDRVTFYSNTIVEMIKSPVLNFQSSDKKSFMTALQNATFPVLQLLDYVPNENGVYVPRADVPGAERTQPYVASYNGFLLPNFVTIDQFRNAVATYPGAIDGTTSTVLDPTVYGATNLPFLNTSLQPVYTLELETQEPDTGSIGGKIVV
jgi:hypothetical protein